jgi:hypothetical protein
MFSITNWFEILVDHPNLSFRSWVSSPGLGEMLERFIWREKTFSRLESRLHSNFERTQGFRKWTVVFEEKPSCFGRVRLFWLERLSIRQWEKRGKFFFIHFELFVGSIVRPESRQKVEKAQSHITSAMPEMWSL